MGAARSHTLVDRLGYVARVSANRNRSCCMVPQCRSSTRYLYEVRRTRRELGSKRGRSTVPEASAFGRSAPKAPCGHCGTRATGWADSARTPKRRIVASRPTSWNSKRSLFPISSVADSRRLVLCQLSRRISAGQQAAADISLERMHAAPRGATKPYQRKLAPRFASALFCSARRHGWLVQMPRRPRPPAASRARGRSLSSVRA